MELQDGCETGVSEDDCVVTMVDVLKEQEGLESDADAVLGAADDKECTYNKGYMKRQALYSCLSCQQKTGEVAGICLACSLTCHEGHTLVELYTKRNFRCDCGNSSKFSGSGLLVCSLTPEKDPVNEFNKYNQNFKGLYCVCARPYPDPKNSDEDEMVQCIVCEDWYHLKHLKVSTPEAEEYSEMICDSCTQLLEFLGSYSEYIATTGSVSNATDSTQIPEDMNPAVDTRVDVTDPGPSSKVETDVETSVCLLTGKSRSILKGASFWINGWRDKLCRCEKCLGMYGQMAVSFLLDVEDTVESYEELGKVMSKKSTLQEREMKALSSLSRTQQVEALSGFNEMKIELNKFLKKFAENKEVVSAEHIRQFFAELEQKRRVSSFPPYFCR